MRVDNPDPGLNRGFGLGAPEPELHDVAPDQPAAEHQGVLGHLGETATAGALGGHVEISQLDQDFGQDGHREGLDGLHDSVHAGFGFGGDEQHGLHEGLHSDSLHHDVAHDSHGALQDVANTPDPSHDVQNHHDLGLGFH